MRQIASRDNAQFKSLRALIADPRSHGLALADGIHLVASCLHRGVGIRQVLVSESGRSHAEVASLLREAAGLDCLCLRDSLFRELSGVATPTGIAAVIDIPQPPEDLLPGDAVLLDAVQDAGNLGAILRTAAAAGVPNALLGQGCAGAWTPRALRGGQGAHFALAIREQVDLKAVLTGATAQALATIPRGGTNLYELDLRGRIFWLIGNEGAGLSADLTAAAQLHATIPLVGGSESLNVAAATAVCLFEARRQRGHLRPETAAPRK